MKKILPILLALIMIVQAIPFVTSAAVVAEGEGVLDLYRYNEATGEETFVASYSATGGDTSAAMLEAINYLIADTSVNAHFVIKLNSDVVYPAKYLTYTNTGYRTLTIDGRNVHHLITTNHHNGIMIGGQVVKEAPYTTQYINLNLSNIKLHHSSTGSVVQFYSHGDLTISNCEIIVDGPDYVYNAGNYTMINIMSGVGESSALTILDSTITATRSYSNEAGTTYYTTSVIRTGNYANNVDITIDGTTIKSSAHQCHLIHVNESASSNINITNSLLGVSTPDSETSWSAPIFMTRDTSAVNINLGNSMFYTNCAEDAQGNISDGDVITDPNLAVRGNKAGTSIAYSGYTSIGGYNVFPELIITEVHLNSINASSTAGPFNSTKAWSNMDWWQNYGTHPTSSSGFGSNDFFRYIEVYNASDSPIDLFNYKLIVDTNALVSDGAVNELKLEGGATIGAITNPNSAILDPGKMAILYLYNAVDRDLGCTVENFKGYYGWRYNGQSDDLVGNTLPAARDPHLIVDLTDTMVIAVNDIGSNHGATKLGNFKTVDNVPGNSIYYGLAKNNVAASESKAEWTSWALFEYYTITNANQDDQSTFNFLYGLDASADIREGRRMNEARVTYNCNPGLLQEVQKLNFPYANPEHPESPTITITEINNYTDENTTGKGMDGSYDYFEVANIHSERINIYDYCVFQQYALTIDPFDFSSYYFNQISYIIPSVGKDGTAYGDIQCFTAKNSQAGDTGEMLAYTGPNRKVRFTNPAYEEGWLDPGESAILWMYDEDCYIDGCTLATFKTYFEERTGTSAETTKVFALSGFRNQQGEQGTNSIGISNTSCSLFGIGKLENFTRETDAEHPISTGTDPDTTLSIKTNTYPEVKKDKVYFADSEKYPNLYKNGFSILDCECVVFMFASMINGGGTKDAQLGGVNTSYQYASAYVNGAALKFSGFLATIFPDGYIVDGNPVKNTVVTDEWKASPTVLLDVQNTLIQSFIRNSFEITYNANGGTGADFIQFAHAGEAIALSNGGGFTKKVGNVTYHLVGWSETPSGAEYYAVGTPKTFTQDTTLYAVWSVSAPDPDYTVTIPDQLVFTDRNTAAMTITATLAHFDAGEGLDIVISSPDGKFEMVHTTSSNTVPNLKYTIKNYDSGATIQNNGKVTTFVQGGDSSVYIFAECDAPNFSGTYTDTITFQIVFNDNVS